MFKKWLLIMLSVFVTAILSAQNSQFVNSTPQPQNAAPKVKWLGITVENLSGALRSQLGTRIKTDAGVLIREVEPNSPADRAGLQRFDILMSVEGKAISSSNQLYQIVQQTRTDEAISLEVIRQGEFKTMKSNIGERTVSRPSQIQPFNQPFGGGFNHPFWNSQPNWNSPFFQQPFNRGWQGFNMPPLTNIPKNLSGQSQSWSQSESLSVNTLKDGKIRAELKTKDKDNNEKNYVFEGNRNSVINQIQQQQEISQQHKQQLLGAVQGNSFQFFNNSGFNRFFNNPYPGISGFPSPNPWAMPQTPQPQKQHNRATY